MKKSERVHFVGIKGVGMAPLAVIAKEAGYFVTGSDIADGFITDIILQRSGIASFVGFDESHVGKADLVITTGAHGGYDNIEVQFAKKNKIPILTQGEAVGEFMKGDILGLKNVIGISVTGTHGKTTTTAMIASLLKTGGFDPSWVIGTSEIPSLGIGGHFGHGSYFVAEADEYANEPIYDKTPKMLLQRPIIGVVTNIEHDHPDLYPNLESVRKAFLKFADNLPKDGILVTNGDDPQVKKLLGEFSGNYVTFGFGSQNSFRIGNIVKDEKGTNWTIANGDHAVSFRLLIPGEHNILNATAAYIVAKQFGLSDEVIQKGLSAFSGTKRRMEYIGRLQSGALLYDDYAHHPTEIRKTLKALKEKYPNKRIICIFQPHTFSRTKLLFDQFIDSLSIADEIVLSDIYPSQREAYDTTISSSMIVEKLKLKKKAKLAKTLSDVVQYVTQKKYKDDTIMLTMGAGDIYTIANEILEQDIVK